VPKSPAVPMSPFTMLEGGGIRFGFTMRRSVDVELGLELKIALDNKGLVVQGVAKGSAIDAWNRQCVSGPAAGKEVTPGDTVVSVNAVTEEAAMLEELAAKQLLKFVIVRKELYDDHRFESEECIKE